MDQNSVKQSDFLQHLTQAKERLYAAIRDLDESVLRDQQIVGHWTIKDIIGHLVSWNRELRENISKILDDQHPGYDHQISGTDDFSAWNQVWVDSKLGWSSDQIIADVDRDHQEAVDLIMALNVQQLNKRGLTPWNDAALKKSTLLVEGDLDSVEDLISYHWWHMNHHIAEIEVWREQWESN